MSNAVPPGVTMPFPDHRYLNRICSNCGNTIGGSQESGLCGRCGSDGAAFRKARERLAEIRRGDDRAFEGVDYGDEPA